MRMRIGGLQKVTLLDYPGKVACTVFLPGCNLRCPFCHNPALVLPDRETDSLSTEELLAFLETRRGKLDGVCVTGGEPTLYEDLPALLRQIRGLGFAVKLDTNGTNPDMLEALAQEGLLDYAAMDIKNSPDRYAETCGGVDLLGPVKRSAALLMAGAVAAHTGGDGRDRPLAQGCEALFPSTLCGLRRTGGQRHEAPDKRRDRSAAGQRFA